jgi:hypothetical protein
VAPGYVTLFTKGLPSREIDHMNFLLNDLYILALTPRIHCSEAALQFVENTTFTFLCSVNTDNMSEKSARTSRRRVGVIYM